MHSNEDGSSTRTSTVTLGETRNIVVETQVLNAGEDAFQASFTVAAPTLQVTIDRLSASLNNVSPSSQDFVHRGVDNFFEVGGLAV